jgi:hypothetical protein
MDAISWLVTGVDSFLIGPYRWPEDPVVGWWLGTFFLALWSTILGKMTFALAGRVNRFHVDAVSQEMVDRHRQSIHALQAGEKHAYKAINKLANDAYGKAFFLHIAMAASSLWPLPLALGWMGTRFSHIEFPLLFALPGFGKTVGYPFIFIPLYVLVRIMVGKVAASLFPASDSTKGPQTYKKE